MSTGTPTLARQKPPQPPGVSGPGRGDWEYSGRAALPPVSTARIAVWLLVGAITILFAAFTSTYLVRRGGSDWQTGPLPPLLWGTTVLILASSAGMAWAIVRGRRGSPGGLRAGLAAALALGVAFLAGQIVVWRQLVTAGVYLATNPHSSFFYLLTGAHGVHLAGGITALSYALWKAGRALTPAEALEAAEPVGTYWHFLTGLWVYLFVILFWI